MAKVAKAAASKESEKGEESTGLTPGLSAMTTGAHLRSMEPLKLESRRILTPDSSLPFSRKHFFREPESAKSRRSSSGSPSPLSSGWRKGVSHLFPLSCPMFSLSLNIVASNCQPTRFRPSAIKRRSKERQRRICLPSRPKKAGQFASEVIGWFERQSHKAPADKAGRQQHEWWHAHEQQRAGECEQDHSVFQAEEFCLWR